MHDLLNADQYVDVYESFYDTQESEAKFLRKHDTDWLDEVLRPEVITQFNLNLSGGSDKHTYLFSFNRFHQDSYIINQDFTRNNIRINLDYKPSKWLNFGTNTSMALMDNSALNVGSVYMDAIKMAPNIPVFNPDGSYFYHQPQKVCAESNINSIVNNLGNPVAKAHEDNNVVDMRVISKFYAEIKPVSWLRLKSEFGFDSYNTRSNNRSYETPENEGGNAVVGTSNNLKYVVNNLLTVNKLWKKHMIMAVVGQSFESSTENRLRVSGSGFFDDSEKSIEAASEKGVLSSITKEWAVVSYFTRLNYRFKNRYLAGFTYRIDGSSRFSKNERYRGFPSLSCGWIISEEKFLSEKSWIDQIKIRGSYGLTGLDGSFGGYYGNQGQWERDQRTSGGSTMIYDNISLLYNSQTVNPNLEWETTTSLDVGVDAYLFNNKLDLTIDYFYKYTKNLLANDRVPLFMGWSSQQQNVGEMKNEGIEFTVNTTLLNKGDWHCDLNFNISHIKNKLTKLNAAGYQMATTGGAQRKAFVVGESTNQFYMYDWAGVNPMNGNPLWKYSDGTLDEEPPQTKIVDNQPLANRFACGSSSPDFYGGASTVVQYKNWSMDMAFSFAYGQKMYNGSLASLMTYSSNEANNLSTDILDYWKMPGHKTGVPKLDNNTTVHRIGGKNTGSYTSYDVGRLSNRFLEDASYIRLRNITLNYTFKKPFGDHLHIDRIRLYAQGTNLFTFTGYSGIDPEVSAYGSSAVLSGYDELTLPQSKSIRFGVEINF